MGTHLELHARHGRLGLRSSVLAMLLIGAVVAGCGPVIHPAGPVAAPGPPAQADLLPAGSGAAAPRPAEAGITRIEAEPSIRTAAPAASAVSGSGPLVLEEYPIVTQGVDAPGRLEYARRIAPKILERRQAWRSAGPDQWLVGVNRSLAGFGYRLVGNERSDHSSPLYNLLREDMVVLRDLDFFWPPAINTRGDDFAMLVQEQRGQRLLVRRESLERWEAMKLAVPRPVFVGNHLVVAEMIPEAEQVVVRRGPEIIHTVDAAGPWVDTPAKGLWSWEGNWVLEVRGTVLVDGKSLNEQAGYEEVFGWRSLRDQPFYFFKKSGRIGISYAGHVLPQQYEEVVHYRCCEPAAFNVQGNETMVWFHALRDGVWHYVEAGVYDDAARSPVIDGLPATAATPRATPPSAATVSSRATPSPDATATPPVARSPGATVTPRATQPSVGKPTISDGTPALRRGTLEEARKAVGLAVALPSYLPPGAVQDGPVLYYSAGDRGMISLAYRVGQQHLAVEYHRLPDGETLGQKGRTAVVGPFSATVGTQPKEPSDPFPPISEVIWQDGAATVRVTGTLPLEELLRVARSLY